MATNNGNNIWIWRVLIGILFAVLMFLGKSVIANDQDSRGRDISLDNRVDKVENVISGMQVDIGYIKQGMIEQKTFNTKQDDRSNEMLLILTELKARGT